MHCWLTRFQARSFLFCVSIVTVTTTTPLVLLKDTAPSCHIFQHKCSDAIRVHNGPPQKKYRSKLTAILVFVRM